MLSPRASPTLLLLVACVLALSCFVDVSGESVQASTRVQVDDPNWFFSPYNWNVLPAAGGGLTTQSNNPGAYFKTAFTGSSFVLLLNFTNTPSTGYMTLRWSVDGGVWANALLPWYPVDAVTDPASLALANGLAPNADGSPHSLVLFIANSHQLTDRWVENVNVVRIAGAMVDQGAQLQPYPFLFKKSLLVYWDSIGEGVLTNGRGNPPSDLTDNDSTRNWVQVLAQSLGAEVGAVCYGAQGWINNGSFHAVMDVVTHDDPLHGWSRFDSTHSRLDAAGLLQPPPDYVVMGHATNDHNDPPEWVTACAQAWLGAITVAAGASSHIFLTVPFGQYQAPALHAAYDAFQKEAGNNPLVHIVDLVSFNAQEGLERGTPAGNRNSADGLHPLAWRAEQLGGILAGAIIQQLPAKALHQQQRAWVNEL